MYKEESYEIIIKDMEQQFDKVKKKSILNVKLLYLLKSHYSSNPIKV